MKNNNFNERLKRLQPTTKSLYQNIAIKFKASNQTPEQFILNAPSGQQKIILSALNVFLNKKLDIKTKKHYSLKHRPLTLKEQAILLKNTKNNKTLNAVISAILNSGVRKSELQSLINSFNENKEILTIEGKGGKRRLIPVNKPLKNALIQLKRYQPISTPAITKAIYRLSKKLNIEFSLHNLRSSFATNLKEIGINLHTIKELLGHSNLNTTERYLTTSNKALLDAVYSLEQGEIGNFTREELMRLYIDALKKNKRQSETIANQIKIIEELKEKVIKYENE